MAALALSGSLLIAELVGGIVAGSLALLADAGHLLADVAALSLSLVAITYSRRPATENRTYGYHRLEIFAAVGNATLLLVVAIAITTEAIRRLVEGSEHVDGPLLLGVAAAALLVNAAAARLLHGDAGGSLNVRAAYLEVLSDLFGASAAVVAGALITAGGWTSADSIASLAVAGLIVPRTIVLLREAVDVLLEATPRGVDLAEIRRHLLGTPGVTDVHDLHAWTITSGMPVLSAHVVVADDVLAAGGGGPVLDRLTDCLAGHFDIEHCTFQLEPAGHAAHEPVMHS